MTGLVLTTADWVPELPRGYVRDLRVRWALEEAALPYTVATTPFEDAEIRLPFQPFGQIPWLTDGDVTIFETGAILVYLGDRSPALMPKDPAGRAKVLEWAFAAANSVEPPVLASTFFDCDADATPSAGLDRLRAFMHRRLTSLEAVLADRDWLAGSFSIADILMVDALRLLDGTSVLETYSACRDYVARATARPAFRKAFHDQMAHFEAADRSREQEKEAAG